ncbi:SCO family protein [uncultured Roseobacter sp.]|uniref:SCO family protein n=1 Tax=uncultured Roseobacter sp. TaxID=114847 RepID=UPI00262B78A0|nr:SCO family protein [uncultured Roseobacter sp.]
MRYIAPLAAIAIVGLLGGIWFATQSPQTAGDFVQCSASQVAGGAASIGGPFELVNAEGQTVTDEDVITEPTLIYFGYTFCPDVCPIDAARNAVAVDILAERNISTTPVFISVDPKRDTPDVVGDFAANLHERMIGLTGSPEQVKAASEAYRTYYKAHDSGDDFYLVDHSTFSYLVLPEQGFVEFFRREATAQEIADTVACFVENA